jgi:hypothetical protein
MELIGSGNFDPETAVQPFNARRPLSGQSGGADYDEETSHGNSFQTSL